MSGTMTYGDSGDIIEDTISALGERPVMAPGLTGGEAIHGSAATDLLCCLRGTKILTPVGEVCVETLGIGDRLITRFHGIRPIKWMGRQSFGARFINANRDKLPVRIRADALGDQLPARDLFVSPAHAMLVDETLVLAKTLVNGVTITQDEVADECHYYQIEFETHDCVIAEGTWSESYADVEGVRGQFHNAAEFEGLYPDDRAPKEKSLCAARTDGGARLDAVLRPVVARAAAGLTPGPLRGSIDLVAEPGTVEGWAQDMDHPELPVLLEIVLGDDVIGTILACDYRLDLQVAGLGQGRCAFFFTGPVEISPAAMRTLRVRRAADGAEIDMSAECEARIAGDQTGLSAASTGVRRAA
jgi:hypothetical protein